MSASPTVAACNAYRRRFEVDKDEELRLFVEQRLTGTVTSLTGPGTKRNILAAADRIVDIVYQVDHKV